MAAPFAPLRVRPPDAALPAAITDVEVEHGGVHGPALADPAMAVIDAPAGEPSGER